MKLEEREDLCRPFGTPVAFLIRPTGTSVPGFPMPPLRGCLQLDIGSPKSEVRSPPSVHNLVALELIVERGAIDAQGRRSLFDIAMFSL